MYEATFILKPRRNCMYLRANLIGLSEVGNVAFQLCLDDVRIKRVGEDGQGDSVHSRLAVLVGDRQCKVVSTTDKTGQN